MNVKIASDDEFVSKRPNGFQQRYELSKQTIRRWLGAETVNDHMHECHRRRSKRTAQYFKSGWFHVQRHFLCSESIAMYDCNATTFLRSITRWITLERAASTIE